MVVTLSWFGYLEAYHFWEGLGTLSIAEVTYDLPDHRRPTEELSAHVLNAADLATTVVLRVFFMNSCDTLKAL